MKKENNKKAEEFIKSVSEEDDFLHFLLKGHLFLEEGLERILEQYVFHKEHLNAAELSFSKKMALCRAFCLRKNNLGIWTLLAAINTLRNEVVHNLSLDQRQKKFQKVKNLYYQEAIGFKFLKDIKKMKDEKIIVMACAHCAGFLAKFEEDSKEYRKLIHLMDRTINSGSVPMEMY